MNLEQLTQQTIELARHVGLFIRGEKGQIGAQHVETKGLHDHVTYVDKQAERLLVEGLSKLLPQAGFVVEENTSDKVGDEWDWVVDPLDGTSNFIHGFGPFAVSIALVHKRQEVVLGVVHEIMANETFHAYQGGGAFCNGQPIRCSATTDLTHAMLATGFPYNDFSRLEAHVQALAYFLRKARGMRRMGSAATDLCYVAAGRFDAFWEYNLSPWDLAAGSLIVEEAGGRVADFSGSRNFLFGRELMCAAPGIANEFFGSVSGFFRQV